MVNISLCMIVKNEEKVLERCLHSVKDLVDEIIIVDTGSTDRTKEIAKQFTNEIFDFQWIDDFSAARNFAFKQATKDYIFWLDADDILLEEDQTKFQKLKENLSPDVDAVSMFYHIAFDEFHNPTFSFRRNRLVRRDKNFVWKGVVHEFLDVSGNIFESDIAITHRKVKESRRSDQNLKIYEKQLAQGKVFTSREQFYYSNELKDNGKYEEAIENYEKFLQMKDGWVEDKIRACVNMAECFRKIGNLEKEIDALVKSIMYDVPRPEVSCRLGDLYQGREMYDKAILWYQLALMVDVTKIPGFVQQSYSTWYPYMQLCVCHWKKGDVLLAADYNEKAKQFRPKDPVILQNEKFFQQYLEDNVN